MPSPTESISQQELSLRSYCEPDNRLVREKRQEQDEARKEQLRRAIQIANKALKRRIRKAIEQYKKERVKEIEDEQDDCMECGRI